MKPITIGFYWVILSFIVNSKLLITFRYFFMLKFENRVIKYFLALGFLKGFFPSLTSIALYDRTKFFLLF